MDDEEVPQNLVKQHLDETGHRIVEYREVPLGTAREEGLRLITRGRGQTVLVDGKAIPERRNEFRGEGY